MPTKNSNIIKYNHGEKSMKLPFVIYADLECLLEKMISIHHRVIQYLLIVHSINKKASLIVIEGKIV